MGRFLNIEQLAQIDGAVGSRGRLFALDRMVRFLIIEQFVQIDGDVRSRRRYIWSHMRSRLVAMGQLLAPIFGKSPVNTGKTQFLADVRA